MADPFSFDFTTTEADQNFGDTSQFIFDSPQLETLPLATSADSLSSHDPNTTQSRFARSEKSPAHHIVAKSPCALSSASEEENSSQSSSASAINLRRRSSTSSPPDLFKMNGLADSDGNDDYNRAFDDYDFDSSTFPMGEQGMNDLSLNNLDGGPNSQMDFSNASMSPSNLSAGMFGGHAPDTFSPRHLSSMKQSASMQASPQMTVQPSKMFAIGDSREDSPNSAGNVNSHEGTPPPLYNTSPMITKSETFGSSQNFGTAQGQFAPAPPKSVQSALSSPANITSIVGKWPCELTVDPTPEKSRVETQIPIRLTLKNVPAGITRVHLPTHTISKPKFQTKPPHQPAEDCLELSTMLVCASAMQKGQEIRERALERALSDEIPVRKDDQQASQDENDPTRPLNGGPVTICSGCIVRERKRAARKKTKKQDEEDEWAKDEAKRVIVFNCPENRDWCVPGSKETPVKDHEGPLDSMFVHAPMRIACYCRHQSEKVGFQVIFTLKTSSGRVIAQAMSSSIMITDDHKQPIAQPGGPAAYAMAHGLAGPGIFTSGQAYSMLPGATFQQEMPFRTSFSTNDLQSLRFQMQGYGQPHPHYPSQYTGSALPSEPTTATATPRNLSRPASPTDPTGHSTKKRRSGGLTRAPSGLTMTRIDTTKSPGSNGNGPATAGPLSSGPPSSGFSFTAPTTAGFNSPMDARFPQQALRNPAFQGQSASAMTNAGHLQNSQSQLFGSPPPDHDAYQYYSAPTSQHASRAPSPSGGHRVPFQHVSVPQQAANALSILPSGFDIQNPPVIERVIPNKGSKAGGDEVTILGRGFCKGLEVMFGENMATNITFWGENAISCRSPPSSQLGQVQVLFQHQHHTSPPELRQVQALMPTQLIAYCYADDDQSTGMFGRQYSGPQNMGLGGGVTGMINDSPMTSPGLDQDSLSRGFIANPQAFAGFQQQAQQQQQQRGQGPTGNMMPGPGR